VPTVALLTLCGVTLLCCLLRLQEVIASLVVVRIVFQFLLQGVAVMLPSHRRERQRPTSFRMPLYPLPTVAAMCGFIYILVSRPKLLVELRPVTFVLVSGLIVYGVRAWRARVVHS
jgi:L-asparagine transporter-like permease